MKQWNYGRFGILLLLVGAVTVWAAQDAVSPPELPAPLKLQREVNALKDRVRTLEWQLSGCQGQLTQFAQRGAAESQGYWAEWKKAVEEALGSAWTVNDRGEIVAKETQK